MKELPYSVHFDQRADMTSFQYIKKYLKMNCRELDLSGGHRNLNAFTILIRRGQITHEELRVIFKDSYESRRWAEYHHLTEKVIIKHFQNGSWKSKKHPTGKPFTALIVLHPNFLKSLEHIGLIDPKE